MSMIALFCVVNLVFQMHYFLILELWCLPNSNFLKILGTHFGQDYTHGSVVFFTVWYRIRDCATSKGIFHIFSLMLFLEFFVSPLIPNYQLDLNCGMPTSDTVACIVKWSGVTQGVYYYNTVLLYIVWYSVDFDEFLLKAIAPHHIISAVGILVYGPSCIWRLMLWELWRFCTKSSP